MTASATVWPNGSRFGLFLSHDVDQIHDRELFHALATMNHIKRMALQGEPGSVRLAVKRLRRILLNPKSPKQDFKTILEIETRHGFRSTFFILHDVRRSRNGPRYRLNDQALQRIVDIIQDANGEIGLHGGVKCLNQAAHYRQCRVDLESALSVKVNGIRNHLLKHDGSVTWQAQQQAGFTYDATYGDSDALGPKDGHMFPFLASDTVSPTTLLRQGYEGQADHRLAGSPSLLVLPLTVMDCTLFRSLKLNGKAALEAAWQAIVPVIEAGGLVSLLWHNNYFNEPEYADWQWAYEQLLERLAERDPWCATGAEIADWWSPFAKAAGDKS